MNSNKKPIFLNNRLSIFLQKYYCNEYKKCIINGETTISKLFGLLYRLHITPENITDEYNDIYIELYDIYKNPIAKYEKIIYINAFIERWTSYKKNVIIIII